MYAASVRNLAHSCRQLQEARIACYCRRARVLAVTLLTFIFRYFNSTVAVGGQSYFPFKWLSHYLSVTVRPVWPINVKSVPLAVRAHVCITGDPLIVFALSMISSYSNLSRFFSFHLNRTIVNIAVYEDVIHF